MNYFCFRRSLFVVKAQKTENDQKWKILLICAKIFITGEWMNGMEWNEMDGVTKHHMVVWQSWENYCEYSN